MAETNAVPSRGFLDRAFGLSERGATVRGEFVGGAVFNAKYTASATRLQHLRRLRGHGPRRP